MNRRGLWSMIRDAKRGMFSIICVNYKDRLTRFGFKYIEELLKIFNIEIKIINHFADKSLESELVEDMIAIIHSFSGRLYRTRRGKK